jgi:hypothetical protein
MTTLLTDAKLLLPKEFGDDSERKMEMAGIIEGAKVQVADGSTYFVTFVDCQRLEEKVEPTYQTARLYFGKPGLIVVSRTSAWISTLAACWAASQDYFTHLRPTPYPLVPSAVMSLTYGNGDEHQILREANDRGYLEDVDVEIADGRHFKVAFMLSMRISREIELGSTNGRPFFVEPGLIVVPLTTRLIISSLPTNISWSGIDSEREMETRVLCGVQGDRRIAL